jgi:NADH:ubiquinone oxidoreductase subunit E
MSFAKLTQNEKQIILQCLNAILNGSFLEHEFHARLGIEIEDLSQVVSTYPNIEDSDDNSNETIAINNCLNEVCHGISFLEREWREWFNVQRSEVDEVYRKWAILRGWSRTRIK